MYISEVYIDNIRCFDDFRVSFAKDSNDCKWDVIIGNNSTGKTCFLRCIALGLCDATSSAALMKELSGFLLRDPQRTGVITISLGDDEGNIYSVSKKIINEYGTERIETYDTSADDISHISKNLFLCGYGVQRSGEGDASYEHYSTLEAVYSLFNYYATLQNPELTLLRQGKDIQEEAFKIIREVLLFEDNVSFELTKKGIEIVTNGRRISLSAEGDGYRSTFIWIMDLIGWQIYADRLQEKADLEKLTGVVLIDEIELNLHPQLQRYILKMLKEKFPNIQFIVTSHSAIIAAGVSDFDDAKLMVFKKDNNRIIVIDDLPSFKGMRAEQVLTSVAFDLPTSASIGSVADVHRCSELTSKERTPAEEMEFQSLCSRIAEKFAPGETETERQVGKAIDQTLESMLGSKPTEEIEKIMKDKLKKYLR